MRCDQQPRDGDARGGRPGRGASPPTSDSRGEPRVARRSAPEHAHVGQQLGARDSPWQVRQHRLGLSRPSRAASRLVLKKGGELEEAEQLYREALAARRDVLGASHEDTLNSTFNLAGLLKARRVAGCRLSSHPLSPSVNPLPLLHLRRRATSPEPSRSTARCFRCCGLPSAAGTLTPSTPCKVCSRFARMRSMCGVNVLRQCGLSLRPLHSALPARPRGGGESPLPRGTWHRS